MMSRVLLLLTLLVVLCAAGCRERSSGVSQARVPSYTPPDTKPDARIIAAQERFTCRLLEKLHQREPDRNLFFSPLSLNLALGMLANGARGETLAAVQKAVEWQGLTVEEINAGGQHLARGLKLGQGEPEVAIANSVWVDPQYPLNFDFQQTVSDAYDAAVRALSFSPPAPAAAAINSWAKDKTRGMIPQIVTPEDLRGVFVLLANALYFHGKWTVPFKSYMTHDEPFHLLDGTTKQMPLMDQSGKFRYLEEPGFQAVSLPYGSGRTSLYVFLPVEKAKLGDFLKTVTADKWAQWQQGFAEREGEVKLPRFQADYAAHLKQTLTTMGMGPAFDGSADLSGLGPPGLWVGDVIHKAVVEVNEEGTKAAAVTAIPAPGGAPPPPDSSPFTMVVDRPFLCAIRDNGTGALLFLGVVVNPGELAK